MNPMREANLSSEQSFTDAIIANPGARAVPSRAMRSALIRCLDPWLVGMCVVVAVCLVVVASDGNAAWSAYVGFSLGVGLTLLAVDTIAEYRNRQRSADLDARIDAMHEPLASTVRARCDDARAFSDAMQRTANRMHRAHWKAEK